MEPSNGLCRKGVRIGSIGLTLVEVVVVLLIMGILLGMVFSVFGVRVRLARPVLDEIAFELSEPVPGRCADISVHGQDVRVTLRQIHGDTRGVDHTWTVQGARVVPSEATLCQQGGVMVLENGESLSMPLCIVPRYPASGRPVCVWPPSGRIVRTVPVFLPGLRSGNSPHTDPE